MGIANLHFPSKRRAAGQAIDPVLVKTGFESDERLSQLGGSEYLVRLTECAATPINAGELANLIKDLSELREIIYITENALNHSYGQDITETSHDVKQRLRDELDKLDKRYPHAQTIADITNFNTLPEDKEEREYLGRLVYEGSRVYISGATGAGKTFFGLAIAKAIRELLSFWIFYASNGDTPNVLYLDYEVGTKEMKRRRKEPGIFVVSYDDPRLGDAALLPLDSDDGQKQVLSFIEQTNAKVIIIDNLYSAVIGSIIGGGDKSGAHDKIVPFLRKLSKLGVASILFHHAGHDVARAYGDSRLGWQMTAHLHLERVLRSDGKLAVKVECRKLRGAQMPEPAELVYENGVWETVMSAAKPTELSARQQWLAMTATQLLDSESMRIGERDYPVAFTAELRERYRDKHWAHAPNCNSESQAWGRDTKSLMTYFTIEAVYFFKTRQ